MRRAALLVLAIYLYEKTLPPLVPEAANGRAQARGADPQAATTVLRHLRGPGRLGRRTGGRRHRSLQGTRRRPPRQRLFLADLAADRAGTRFGKLAVRAGEL